MEQTLREMWERQQRQLMQFYQRYMTELEHYTASLEWAIRWLHPPREVYVKGHKPSDEEQEETTS